ncbi:UNVERIFIED_CONTAM: hypothetical protein K2H54_047666 [Gekko kuhli]
MSFHYFILANTLPCQFSAPILKMTGNSPFMPLMCREPESKMGQRLLPQSISSGIQFCYELMQLVFPLLVTEHYMQGQEVSASFRCSLSIDAFCKAVTWS